MITYSIVIPVFNAEETLLELVNALYTQIYALYTNKIEIILTEDGSEDNSWAVLQKIRVSYPNITIIKLTKNFGQAAATLCGIQHAKGDYIITFDDDLQYNAKDIQHLIEYYLQHQNKHLVVYGTPIKKQQNNLHKLAAQLVAFYQFKMVLGQKKRTQLSTSFRIFSRKIGQLIVGNYLVDIDSCINWYIPENKIGFLGVHHNKRKYGQSGYTFWKKASIVFNYHLYFISPLVAFIFIGILLGLYGFLIFLSYTFTTIPFIVFSSPFNLIYLFLFALLFLGIGILGSYLAKIYLLSLGKKMFLIEEIQTPVQPH